MLLQTLAHAVRPADIEMATPLREQIDARCRHVVGKSVDFHWRRCHELPVERLEKVNEVPELPVHGGN